MLKTLCFISLFLLFMGSKGQELNPKLYYFITSDSTYVGVKDEFGKIIIQPVFSSFFLQEEDLMHPITTETIEFYGRFEGQEFDLSKPAIPAGTVYSRNGDFLYQAQLFDNGPDYWAEGVRRYVENGKMGFVDQSGYKITQALWDFALPFNYGYAEVMEGNLKKVYDSSGEHWTIGSDAPIVTYLINQKGERIEGSTTSNNSNDYYYAGKYYPCPFEYSTLEQEILTRLQHDIVGITLFAKSNYYDYIYAPVQLEITERPNLFRPYYVIKLYDNQDRIGLQDIIFVDAVSLVPYVNEYNGSRVPLQLAIMDRLTEFVESTKEGINGATKNIAQKELQRIKSRL